MIQQMQKDRKGFTLIELLTVIAVIGILAAIAIPVYLGQREKARVRCVEAGAKGSQSEIQGWLDSWLENAPFIALDDDGVETCYEGSDPGPRTCNIYYPGSAVTDTYDRSDIENIIDIAVAHHEGKNDRNCYNDNELLFVKDTPAVGVVVLTAAGSRSIRVHGYAEDTDSPVFDVTIPLR